MMLAVIKAYAFQGMVIVALGLVLLLGLQTWRLQGVQLQVAQLKVTLSEERTQAANALALAHQHSRATEQSLQTAAAQTRKDANHAVSVAVGERDRLIKRLRYAESQLKGSQLSATTAVTGDGAVAQSDAGTELPARIGEADVEEAYRAERIRIELQSCYRQYDDARQALSKHYGN